ncbi:hypothetical protein ACFLYS_00235 [Chloroflexota bacterium]
MGSFRIWFFRFLVAVAASLMILSFAMPWWTVDLMVPEHVVPPDTIRIYGFGLQHDLVELRPFIEADETPFYQTVLAWVFVGVSVSLILFSTWLKGRKSNFLLGGFGLIYILYVFIAIYVVIAGRIDDFGIALTGWSSQTYTQDFDVSVTHFASFEPGYYLAYAAGGLCLFFAILRNRIIGKTKPED